MRHALLQVSLGLVTASLTLHAQDLELVGVAVEERPDVVLVADLDGNGQPDLVTLHETGLVTTRLATGDRSWGPPAVLDPGLSLLRGAVGDLDGDGLGDLVLGKSGILPGPGDEEVHVRLGVGDGTFLAPVAYDVAKGTADVVLVDQDGDGHLDLATSGRDSGRVTLRPGMGDGTFGARTDLAVTSSPTSLLLADLDGLHGLDLVVAEGGGAEFVVRLDDGAGGWGPAQVTTLTMPGAAAISDLASGDLDGDGQADLALGQGSGRDFVLAYGRGDGTFEDLQEVEVGSSPITVAVADVDEDGLDDALALCRLESAVAILAGTADRTPQAPRYAGAGYRPEGLAVIDLDGDGDLDLVSADPSNPGLVTSHYGDGDGTFGGTYAPVPGELVQSVFVTDMTGDGWPDLLAGLSNGDLVRLDGQGDGTFEGSSALAGGLVVGPALGASRLVDMNGDTVLDLVGIVSPATVVHLGQGDGTFGPVAGSGVHHLPENCLDVGDVDGDGDADIVITGGDSMAVFKGDGTGALTLGWGQAMGLTAGSCAVADVNLDGDLDLVVAASILDGVSLALGNGNGSFQAHVVVPTGPNDHGLSLEDMDVDGDVDLVTVDDEAAAARVQLNDGTGSFGAGATQALASAFQGAWRVDDADGDGVPDLLVSSAGGGFGSPSSLEILLGQGDGTLGAPAVTLTLSGAGAPHTGDVDRDGVPDVLLTGNEGRILVLRSTLGPWDTLGEPLSGAAGLPRLFGTGALALGAPSGLTLRDALPNTIATLFVGASTIHAPFKQGVLVPSPDLVITPFLTDGDGTIAWAVPFPADGPSGASLVFQYWIVDPAGPAGLAASNAVRGTLP